MEQNRNIDFDSVVEVDSLKDAVWRLTTRVYLLEDFIAERFGEVIGPSGFTKSTITPVPGTSGLNSSSTKETPVTIQTASSSPENGGKRRKRELTVSSHLEAEGRSNKVQKNMENTKPNSEADNEERIGVHGLDFEQSGNDPLLIPKDEVFQGDCDNVDPNDYFLNENSDDDEDPNESEEKDPDFNPSSHSQITVSNRHNEMQDRVGESFTLIKSNKGNQLLVDSEKNTYGIHQKAQGGKKIMWRCNRYYDIKCKGRCYTLEDKMYMVFPHSHFESEEDFKVREIKLKIKEMAATTTFPPNDIIATVLDGIDDAVKARLPKMKTLLNLVPQTRLKEKRGSKRKVSTNVVTPKVS